MFGIRALFLLSLVINVLVNGYQDDGHLDGELEDLLKRLQERLEDEERGYELEDLFERGFGNMFDVEVDQEVSDIYFGLKYAFKYKWATFKIENRRRIVLDKLALPKPSEGDSDQFNEMKNALTFEPRYIIFDFHFISKKGRPKTKVASIFWLDEKNAKSNDKMIYTSGKDDIEKKFIGSVKFTAKNKGDLDYKTYQDEIERLS